jgi:hypothetical protein
MVYKNREKNRRGKSPGFKMLWETSLYRERKNTMHSDNSDTFQSNWGMGVPMFNSAGFLDASPLVHKSHSMWADTIRECMTLDQAGSTFDRK